MQLHNILIATGSLLLIAGLVIADSDPVVIPLSMLAGGLLVIGLGLRESGAFKKPRRSGNSMRGKRNNC